jgi:hypothetical protein
MCRKQIKKTPKAVAAASPQQSHATSTDMNLPRERTFFSLAPVVRPFRNNSI